eukprot:SAG22_NODE_4453_length_1263_cov_1.658076_1_plen_272_part_01
MPFHHTETEFVDAASPRKTYHAAVFDQPPARIEGDIEKPQGKRTVAVPTGLVQRPGMGGGRRVGNSAHAQAVEERMAKERAKLQRRAGEPCARPSMDYRTTSTEAYNAGGFEVKLAGTRSSMPQAAKKKSAAQAASHQSTNGKLRQTPRASGGSNSPRRLRSDCLSFVLPPGGVAAAAAGPELLVPLACCCLLLLAAAAVAAAAAAAATAAAAAAATMLALLVLLPVQSTTSCVPNCLRTVDSLTADTVARVLPRRLLLSSLRCRAPDHPPW